MVINSLGYNLNVFINCPFDDGYNAIFEAIVFTICDCGFTPRCAKEREDSSEVRIQKILEIISECKHGIHDISIAGADPKTKLARFNMPYELGLFTGCKKFGDEIQNKKSCLILDKTPYRYASFLSDIAGQDIRAHENNPQKAAAHVRNFLAQKSNRKIPSASIVWERYINYKRVAPRLAKEGGLKIDEVTFRERLELISTWVKIETKTHT